MTQEKFQEMRILNDVIIELKTALEEVRFAEMEMCLPSAGVPERTIESYKDNVNRAYYYYIPKEERDRLTSEMREKLSAAIQARINELKAEFEQL